MMRRLRKDERQRERAERDLRNLISQVQDYKQERGEHDAMQQREDTTIKSSDQKLEKSHKRQKQEWMDRANEQSSVASQTAQQRVAKSAEEKAKIDSSGYHSGSDTDRSSARSAVMSDSGEATSHEYTPADKQEDLIGVFSVEQVSIISSLGVGLKCIELICNRMSVKSHIAHRISISWIVTWGVLLVVFVMSPASNQMAAIGPNNPATTINFDREWEAPEKVNPVIKTKDTASSENSNKHTEPRNSGEIKLDEKHQKSQSKIENTAFKGTHCHEISAHYVSKHWEDKTVATKCSKCGKARKTVPVEGTAMAAAATSAAGKTPLTVENVQEAVVKALATQAPAAAAFAGMHEFERGNGFGLEEHTAFGAIAEGVTADEASLEGVGAGKDDDSGTRRGPSRGPNLAATIMNGLPWLSVGMVAISMAIFVVAQMMAYVGNVGTGVVYLIRWVAAMTLAGAGSLACAVWIPWVIICVLGLPPTAAYSAGIGHRAHAPAIYSAMHLRAHAKLDPAVWAPVENSFGREHNSSQTAKWESIQHLEQVLRV